LHLELKLPQEPKVEEKREELKRTRKVSFPMTLEEVLKGFKYSQTLEIKIYSSNGDVLVTKSKQFELRIPPGTQAGTTFSFPHTGDQYPDNAREDIVFVAEDQPHKHFIRNGADIEYLVPINRRRSRRPIHITVPTLEGKEITYSLKEPLVEDCTRTIKGHGLPYPDNIDKRGNLVLKFVATFRFCS